METFFLFLGGLFWGFVLLFITGMIRSVYVLWFLDRSNRLLVLKYYGIPALILGITYRLALIWIR